MKTPSTLYRAPTHLLKLLRGRHNDEDMASGGIEKPSGGYFGGDRSEGSSHRAGRHRIMLNVEEEKRTSLEVRWWADRQGCSPCRKTEA